MTNDPRNLGIGAAPAKAAVEYRFFAPSAGAQTAEHARELNELGTERWHVVAPIYAGGMLNSFLISREQQ